MAADIRHHNVHPFNTTVGEAFQNVRIKAIALVVTIIQLKPHCKDSLHRMAIIFVDLPSRYNHFGKEGKGKRNGGLDNIEDLQAWNEFNFCAFAPSKLANDISIEPSWCSLNDEYGE